MRSGFIVQYNNSMKCGFAKLLNEGGYIFGFRFFKLEQQSSLKIEIGDIINFNQQISNTTNELITEIHVQDNQDKVLLTFEDKSLTTLLVINDKNMVANYILGVFDRKHYLEKYRFISNIDENSRRGMILSYLNDDISSGDSLLKSFIENYVTAMSITNILEENFEVIYLDRQYTYTYGGRDYTDHHYEICYESKFNYPLDMYMDSLYSRYIFEIIGGCSEYYSEYMNYHLIMTEYIKEHKNEMELHCKIKTLEMRHEIISNYNQLEHIERLYLHFKNEIFRVISEIKNCKERIDKFWQYNPTIDFFKEYPLDKDISNQYEFSSWLNKIKKTAIKDSRYNLTFDSIWKSDLVLTLNKNKQ